MLIIADGGVSNNIPDTMDAIMLTKNISYIDGVKLDLRESHDKEFVLFPSDELNTFTLSNKKIKDVSYDYLKKVKYKSHIFKYYVPKLEEVLKKYNKNKIIILDLYINDYDKLFNLLKHYPYQYIFLINEDIGNNTDLLKKLGEVKLKEDVLYINKDNINNLLKINKNIIITTCPLKAYQTILFRQK